MKRVWATLLTFAMMVSLAVPASAAEKATATTMRLMETEGTASVENAAGKTLTVTKNMRLYNGYEVSTEAASYAYVSLDSSKAVKLDASSTAEVSKSGRQLELKLTDGKLFFNVPVALEKDESMEIRTSTMMMGVRGTAGWVSVLDRYTTRIGVLEGMVTIYSQDPITGADRSVTITGGQTATIIRHERAQAMEQELIRQGVIIEANIVEELTELGQVVEELREDGVPGFAAAEVAKDSDLQDRINNESPLDAELIAQNAEQKLAADEAAAALKEVQQEAAQQPQDETTPASTKNLFAETKTVVVTETEVITKTEEVEVKVETYFDLDDPTAEQVNNALDDVKIAAVTHADLDLADISVDEGEVLYIVSGEVTNSSDDASMTGTLTVLTDATMNNSGTLTVNSTNSLHVYGTLTNEEGSSIVLGGEDGAGRLVVEQGGKLVNYGEITLADDASSFVVLGEYEDYVNEVMSQTSAGTVTYLGSFEDIIPSQYSGMTFKVLNAGTVTTANTLWFSESQHITLDMNGNEADLVNRVTGEGGPADEVNRLVMGLLDLPRSLEEDYEEFGSTNLTLIDSVGGGKLTGHIEVNDGSQLRLKSGTLVVPEDETGVLFDSGNFVMTGGTIDAREDDAIALDPGDDHWSGYDYRRNLRGGIIIGGTPTPNGAYYRYYAPGEGNPLPIVREGSSDDSGSDAELDFDDGYDEGLADGEDDTYYTGWRRGYTDAEAGYEFGKNYDHSYQDSFDAGYESGFIDCPYEEDYAFGYYVGQLEGAAQGYDKGYRDGYEKYCRANGTGDYAGSTYADGYDNGYSDGRFDAQDDSSDDADIFGTSIAFHISFYKMDSGDIDSPFYLCSAVYDSEEDEEIGCINLGSYFITPQA